MAEYYPLLSKAVGSLPNSTPDTRRVVYERARKALIGQLRTLHPPVPDEDIDAEALALDRAIERIETELANPSAETPTAAASPGAPSMPEPPPASPPPPPPPIIAPAVPSSTDPAPKEPGVEAKRPFPPLRTKPPGSRTPRMKAPPAPAPVTPSDAPGAPADGTPNERPVEAPRNLDPEDIVVPAEAAGPTAGDPVIRPRSDTPRPVAPQPPAARGPRRHMWIIPAGIVVVAGVAIAAWQLRDKPETLTKTKATEQPAQTDSGKIAERVGEAGKPAPAPPSSKDNGTAPSSNGTPAPNPQTATKEQQPAPNNPELPVAHRAALLVEVKGDTGAQSQVKTFLGTVVWKLKNTEGPNESPGLAVEADVDVPEDKLKAVVTFEKNTDVSLPASHTIKVRFVVGPGSYTGDVKQISVPQMRKEDNPSGDGLSGVTVPVIQNTFLVGLSPGNAETANMDLLKGLEWIDIPMLLTSGRIAKLTFEKSDSGQRDLAEAIASWVK